MSDRRHGPPATGRPASGRPDSAEYAPFYAGYVAAVEGEDLLAALRRPGLAALARDLDPALATHAYAPGKWTVAEVVQHVVDTERVFQTRVLRIARGDRTPLPGFDQDPYAAAARARPLADLAGELDRLRASTVDLVGSLTSEDLARVGTVTPSGTAPASGAPMSARAAAWVIAGHERHHAGVLSERYLQPWG